MKKAEENLPAGDEQRYYKRLKMHEELIDLINSHRIVAKTLNAGALIAAEIDRIQNTEP